MPLFFGDFLGATSEWEGIERSLYLTLLAYNWSQGSLPTDRRKLAKLVDWDKDLFESCWAQVSQKFVEIDGRLVNRRLEQHRARAKEISAKNAAAGKKGAAAKWRKAGERQPGSMADASAKDDVRDGAAMAGASQKDSGRQISAVAIHTNPIHTNPSHPIQSKTSHPSGARGAPAPAAIGPDRSREAFELAQATYPAGTYRGAAWLLAERNFGRLIDDGIATAAELVEAATAYRDQQQAMGKIGTQYVLSPAKFYDPREANWRGPFPKPRTKAQVQQDANVAAGLEWLSRSEAGADG
ncbi:MAG: DUF1376 domain-containing protein [Steroidobacteraceae bacterium]|nr:DUF1376 domain-containing protein [Nevskiaceae bacterium]MCP5467026.1 DUF1376 domain-containing protein [Nevskiaceae bacterium]MCP5472301.1 DUF1376 domain-containing protein [Nevskiaceae bacterium]